MTWDPAERDLSITDLEIVPATKKAGEYRILRNSLCMEMREVGDKYRLKMWALQDGNKEDPSKRKAIFTDSMERKRIGYQVSRNLDESLALNDRPGLKRSIVSGNRRVHSTTTRSTNPASSRPENPPARAPPVSLSAVPMIGLASRRSQTLEDVKVTLDELLFIYRPPGPIYPCACVSNLT